MSLFGPPSIEKLKARADLKGIARATSYPDEEIRAAALAALAETKVPAVLPYLVRGIHDPVPAVRIAAVQAIGALGAAAGQEPLAAVLQSSDLLLQEAALQAMGKLKVAEAVPLLAEATSRTEPPIRRAALEGLRQIATGSDYSVRAALIPAFVPLLTHRRSDVRRLAADALQRLDWLPDDSPAGASFLILCDEIESCVMFGAVAIEPLISTLHDERPEARAAARRALREIGTDALAPLVRALGTDNPVGYAAIKETLADFGPRATDELLEGLDSEQPRTRMGCLELLAATGDPRIPALMLHYLADSDWQMSRIASESLRQMGDDVIPELVDALRQTGTQVRWRAAEVLDQLNWKPTADAAGAIYFITRGDWNHCIGLGSVAVEPLLEAMTHWDEKVRRGAAHALVQLGAPAIPGLLQMLSNQHTECRATAAWALGKLHAPDAAQALPTLLYDPDPHVQEAAIGALIRISTPPEVFVAALNSPNLLVRKTAAWALGHHRYTLAVPALLKALHDPVADMRDTAARALGEIGNPQAIEPLLQLVNDPDPQVRATIAEVTRYLHRHRDHSHPTENALG